MFHLYELALNIAHTGLELRLNDFPVFDGAGNGTIYHALVNPWLVDGRNTVRMQMRSISLLSSAHIRIGIKCDTTLLYSYSWQGGEIPSPPPNIIEGEFISEAAFGLWSWQQAADVTLDLSTISVIGDLVQKMHQALDARDIPTTLALLQLRTEEQAHAFSLPLIQRQDIQKQFFANLYAQPSWRMQPLDISHLSYQLCGGGKWFTWSMRMAMRR